MWVIHLIKDSTFCSELMAVFTLETNKSSGRTNRFQTNKSSLFVWCEVVWYLAVWKDNFSQMICPSRQTSRRQHNINSHQTDKCQTICPSRRFVRPLVWKRPMKMVCTMHVLCTMLYMHASTCLLYMLAAWGNLISMISISWFAQ